MKTSSCKSKGRRLQQWIAQKISDLIELPWGPDEQVASREMGQSGPDIRLIGDARHLFPWSVECKNQEKWSIHQWIQQAKDNQMPGTDWLLICKKNRSDPVVVIDAEVFFCLLRLISGRVKGR